MLLLVIFCLTVFDENDNPVTSQDYAVDIGEHIVLNLEFRKMCVHQQCVKFQIDVNLIF